MSSFLGVFASAGPAEPAQLRARFAGCTWPASTGRSRRGRGSPPFVAAQLRSRSNGEAGPARPARPGTGKGWQRLAKIPKRAAPVREPPVTEHAASAHCRHRVDSTLPAVVSYSSHDRPEPSRAARAATRLPATPRAVPDAPVLARPALAGRHGRRDRHLGVLRLSLLRRALPLPELRRRGNRQRSSTRSPLRSVRRGRDRATGQDRGRMSLTQNTRPGAAPS